MRLSILTLIGFAVINVALESQANAIQQSFQGWNRITLLTPPGPARFYVQVQPQRQWVRVQEQLTQFELKSAAVFPLAEMSSFWLGVAWVPTMTPDYINELRLWEAIQTSHFLREQKSQFEYRLRLEERWIGNSSGVAYRLSGRVYFRNALHLKLRELNSWGLSTYAEVYLNLNTVPDTVPAGFGESELFLGPMWQAAQSFYLQIGYMNQVSRGTDGIQMFHVLFTQMNFIL